jgi:hypothetical protein
MRTSGQRLARIASKRRGQNWPLSQLSSQVSAL